MTGLGPGGDRVFAEMEQHAAEMNERIAKSHEVVACPKCKAPVGRRCCRMPLGYAVANSYRGAIELRHPHPERWTQVVPRR